MPASGQSRRSNPAHSPIIVCIDGRKTVGAHGSREMPIWGTAFREDAAELTRGFGISPKDAELYVRGRIISLIGYIYTLQAK